MIIINSIFMAAACLFISATSFAAEWRETENHRFRIFLGSYDDKNESRLYGGFVFETKGNWKTYWKYAGDAGLPLKLRQESHNVIIHWPAPRRFFYEKGLYSYVYDAKTVIPFSLPVSSPLSSSLAKNSDSVRLRLKGDYSVCDIVCVPYQFDETLKINLGDSHPDADRDIALALNHLPQNIAARAGLDFDMKADRNVLNISFNAAALGNVRDVRDVRDVIVDSGDSLSLAAPKIIADGDKVSALFVYRAFDAVKASAIPKMIKAILVQTDDGAFQILGEAQPALLFNAALDGAPRIFSWTFFLILASAFLGGLILNIMPCVLPVISLKLAGMTRSAMPPRAQLGWTIAGIFIAFILFALLVYVLQQAGQIVGWGFHFQQPVFVLFMMSILLFFSFTQIGFLDLRYESAAQNAAARFLDYWQPSRPAFHIFYGGLITLLATPCTAPFLGSAVGFALTQSFAEIVLVFMAIALGLAVPWLIWLIWLVLPEQIFARYYIPHIPRSGRWMIYVKNFAALLLYGSSLWLLWVASGQLGSTLAISFFVMMNVIFIAAAKIKSWPFKYAAAAFILAIISAPLILPASPSPSPLAVSRHGLNWHEFNEARLLKAIKAGKIVFVDISADWCLTCQYNKVNVLLDEDVITQLGREDIYLMSGDLTNVNEAITIFLQKEGRSGIPFNALYGYGQKEIFSEILSKNKLLQSLKRFKTRSSSKH